ncbi:MAG: hypothetical protein HFH62_08025 [Lachnospiraceae bacterium]|nr:hypothetical protein [Lachnospiraceae bacterium]
MGLKATEQTTELVLGRMENSLDSLEQMSFDSINITDKLVSGIDVIRQCVMEMKEDGVKDLQVVSGTIEELLNDLLVTAFEVNNVAHELEKETAYQRDTLDSIKQIVELLYAMK